MKFVIKPSKPSLLSEGEVGTFMSVDPGLGGTGWAIWDRYCKTKLVKPVRSGAIKEAAGAESKSIWRRIHDMAYHVNYIAVDNLVCEVVVEQPQFFEGGVGLAAARRGDLVTLSILVGAILAKCVDQQSKIGHLVSVNEWKGNLKKEETARRIHAKLPDLRLSTDTSHEMDAIGIGLWAKGHF